jgi:Asp-tRNA(Asn)/Glu-tRNA(Gln) amidotransferase A subunit family amidase
VLRDLYDTPGADSEILALMDRAIADLREAGAIVIDPFEIADFEQLTAATGFCSRFRFDLEAYLHTLGEAAPIRSLDEVAQRGAYLPHNEQAMQWALEETRSPEQQIPPCVDVQGDPRRKALLDAIVTAMDAADLDALIYPTWSNPPRKLGDTESPHGNNSPAIAPHSGQPAITVPMGFTTSGLPAGLQLLARPFDEHKLLRYAYAYEQLTRHRTPPAGFPPLPQHAP